MGAEEINLDKIADAAVEIKMYKDKLEEAVKEINSIIGGIQKQYSTDTTKNILAKYSEYKKGMTALIKKLDEYYKFLLETEDLYERVEKRIAARAAEVVAVKFDDAINDWL